MFPGRVHVGACVRTGFFLWVKSISLSAAAHGAVLPSVGGQKRHLPSGYESNNTTAVRVQVSVWTRVPGSRLCAEEWGCWADGTSVFDVWRSLQTVSRALAAPSQQPCATGPGSAPTLVTVLFGPCHLSWGEGGANSLYYCLCFPKA